MLSWKEGEPAQDSAGACRRHSRQHGHAKRTGMAPMEGAGEANQAWTCCLHARQGLTRTMGAGGGTLQATQQLLTMPEQNNPTFSPHIPLERGI